MKLFHAREVVGDAADVLVGKGTTRERLLLAAKILLGIVPREFYEFPELNEQYQAIHQSLSKVSDERYGSYEASVRAMSGPAMGKLTQAILDLDRDIRTVP